MPSKRIVVSSSSFITAGKISASSGQNNDTLLTLDKVLDAFLAVRQRVEKWPSHSYRLCTKTQGFDNVCAAPDAAVDINLEVLEYFGIVTPDLEQCEK
jgi:hypothetical protein